MKQLRRYCDFFKKWFLVVLLIIAFVISIYLSTGGDSEKETQLILWGLGGGNSPWDHGWRKLNKLFEERHPGVKLVTAPHTEGAIAEKLMSTIVGNAAPDVVGGIGNQSYTAEWAARGAFLPLDDLIERDQDQPNAPNPSDWVEGAVEAVRYQGKIYGVPINTIPTALFYNEDALISAGFTDENGQVNLPKTMEGYLRFCKEYSIRDNKGHIKRLGSLMGYHHMMRVYRMGLMFGGRFFSEDGRRATFTDPDVVKALEFMTAYSDYLGGPDKFQIFNVGDWREGTGGGDKGLFSGQLGTLMHGQYYLTNIVYNAPDLNYGITDLPFAADAPRKNLVVTHSAVIPRGAKHPELAWEYLKWVISPEAQLIATQENFRITKSRGIPFTPFLTGIRPVDSLLYHEVVKDNPDYKPQTREIYKIFLGKLGNSINTDPVSSPLGKKVMRELDRAHNLAMFHVMTPYEALKQAEDKIQRELDEFYSTEKLKQINWSAIVSFFSLLSLVLIIFLIWQIKKRQLTQSQWRDLGGGLVSITPWIIGFLVFLLGPIVFSIILSFTSYSGLSAAKWVGLKNYQDLILHDPLFWRALGNTVFMLIAVPLNMMVGLGIALLLNMKVRGVNIYRTIYYLPSIIPFVAASILWLWILDPTDGIINILLRYLGIQGPAWLGDAKWTKPAMILMGLWTAGGGMIIWLAGLKGIPQQFYESARVDGANWWKQFRYITIPMLTPYIFFNLIMGIIGTLQIFAQAVIFGTADPRNAQVH